MLFFINLFKQIEHFIFLAKIFFKFIKFIISIALKLIICGIYFTSDIKSFFNIFIVFI